MTSRLLQLPFEIRLMILKLLLVSSTKIKAIATPNGLFVEKKNEKRQLSRQCRERSRPTHSVQMLQVCRQLLDEGRLVLYGENVFRILLQSNSVNLRNAHELVRALPFRKLEFWGTVFACAWHQSNFTRSFCRMIENGHFSTVQNIWWERDYRAFDDNSISWIPAPDRMDEFSSRAAKEVKAGMSGKQSYYGDILYIIKSAFEGSSKALGHAYWVQMAGKVRISPHKLDFFPALQDIIYISEKPVTGAKFLRMLEPRTVSRSPNNDVGALNA